MTAPSQSGERVRSKLARILVVTVAVLLAVHLSLSAGLYWAMSKPPDVFGSVMKHVPLTFMMVLPFETLWKQARGGQLRAGDAAPDFRLPTFDHSNFVTLSSLRGTRPVVLVFGSYT